MTEATPPFEAAVALDGADHAVLMDNRRIRGRLSGMTPEISVFSVFRGPNGLSGPGEAYSAGIGLSCAPPRAAALPAPSARKIAGATISAPR